MTRIANLNRSFYSYTLKLSAFLLRGRGGARFRGRWIKKPTKLGVVPLVEEQLVADLLHHNVPAVHGARAAHDGGKDHVRGKHVRVALCQLPEGKNVHALTLVSKFTLSLLNTDWEIHFISIKH